jgi:hypothetical protein
MGNPGELKLEIVRNSTNSDINFRFSWLRMG